MDTERAATNWGLTMSQAKVKQQCGLVLNPALPSLVFVVKLHFVSRQSGQNPRGIKVKFRK